MQINLLHNAPEEAKVGDILVCCDYDDEKGMENYRQIVKLDEDRGYGVLALDGFYIVNYEFQSNSILSLVQKYQELYDVVKIISHENVSMSYKI